MYMYMTIPLKVNSTVYLFLVMIHKIKLFYGPSL